MKVTLDTIGLIRDLTTTTIKISNQEKFDVASIVNYGPYVSRIINIKDTVKEIPEEFRQANPEAIKAVVCSIIDAFFAIRDQIRTNSETLQTETTVLQ